MLQRGARLPAPPHRTAPGFTLLELLVVMAIMALATAGVGLALRDSAHSQLEREGVRLAALLESARAQSRASGLPTRWQATAQGFRFEGLPPKALAALPTRWLGPDTLVSGNPVLRLGPEPLIGPQQVLLTLRQQPDQRMRVTTDGVRPFQVQPLR